jgi:ribose transport system ATP-binding protein
VIKILTGVRARAHDLLNGKEYNPHSPRDARQQGISTLFQELNVVDQLTVEDNLTLGMEDTKFGFLRKTDKINKIANVMNSLEPSIKPRQLVSTLSVAKKQIVEIAKAVATESDIIIMDEPTAALSKARSRACLRLSKPCASAMSPSFTSRTGSTRSSRSGTT